jgi:hypothetical protein
MKHIVFAVLLFAFSNAIAQDSTKAMPKTRVEGMAIKSGVLIQQEYAQIGTVVGVEFDAVKVTDVNAQTVYRGVYIATKNLYTSTTTYSAFIDEDELNSILSTLDYLTSSKFKFSSEATDVQVVYTSRGDFQIGCYSDGDKWKFFLKLDKFRSNSRILLGNDKDLRDVVAMFKKSKEVMLKF